MEEEFPRDERGHERFPETHDIREEESIVPLEKSHALRHGIHLVAEPLEAFGEVICSVGIVVDGFAEILGQEFEIELVRSDFSAEISLRCYVPHIFRQHIHGFLPESFKFRRGELHVLKIMEQDIEFIVGFRPAHPEPQRAPRGPRRR